MKNIHKWSGFWLAVAAVFVVAGVQAGEPTLRTKKPAGEKLAGLELSDWQQVVRDLDSDDYPVREQASRQLAQGGAPVVPLVAQAIRSGSPEVIWRGTKALEQIAVTGDAAALEAVVFAVQELAKDARPELATMVADLRERQKWFHHRLAVQQLRQAGAEVQTVGEDGEVAAEDAIAIGGFGGVIFGGPIIIDEEEVMIDDDLADEIVAVEWEGEPAVMTREEQLAMFEPIEVTFIDQFKAAAAAKLPPALAGWEDVTVEDVMVSDASPPREFADAELFPVEAAEPEELMPEGAVKALERLATIEAELAKEGEIERAVEAVEVAKAEVVEAEVVEAFAADEVILADFAGPVFFGDVEGGQPQVIVQTTATIGKEWQAGDEGLKSFRELEGQVALTLKDAPLTDGALKHFAEIKQLTSLAIQGGDFTPGALLKFHRDYPKLQISARSNGWMGINAFGAPCQIENVVVDSAAAEAGLKEGDQVLKIEGHEVKDFTELTLAMVSRDAGDVVRVTIKRGEKLMDVNVKLHQRP